VNNGSATTAASFTLPVSNIVLRVGEAARPKIKIDAIKRHQFRDEFCFSLLGRIVTGVSVNETAAFAAMSMEIDKHFQPTRSMTLKHGVLGC
jgi:hypothetical protein